jgi:hypothetical protein
MADENVDSDLEARAEALEVRMQHMLYCIEGSNLQLFHLRHRLDNLEILCQEFQERCSRVPGLEVQQEESLPTTSTPTEEPHGSTERQDRPTYAIEEHDYQQMDKGTIFEIMKQVKQMAKNLEGKLEAVELSGDSLQVAERESSHQQEDLTQDDEKSDHPSTRSGISDKSEHHTMEDPRQVEADKEEEGLIEAKDVGTEEFGQEAIVSVRVVEQPEQTQEMELIKAGESIEEGNDLDEKPEAEGTVELEDDRTVSDNYKQESNECQIPVVEIAGSSPKDLTLSEKQVEMATPVEVEGGTDRKKCGRRQSARGRKQKGGDVEKPGNVRVGKEGRSLQPAKSAETEELLRDLESVIAEELAKGASARGEAAEEMTQSEPEEEERTEQDYELEMLEIEWRIDQSDLTSVEEAERRLSEDASRHAEIVQTKIQRSLQRIIHSIENKMHAKLPNDIKKSLEECFRKVVESSLKEMSMSMHSVKCRLKNSIDMNYWLEAEMGRVYTELMRKRKKEDSYRKRICVLQEKLNNRLTVLKASDDYCRQLLGKYDEVTLNIELEMKKHRSLCEDYRNLRSEYEKLKAKCETTADSEGACAVAGQASAMIGGGHVGAGCAAADVEKQMSVLAESQRKLKRKVRSFREVRSMAGNLGAERVEDYVALDEFRKVFMGVLERQPRETQPHSQYELIERMLTKAIKERVSTVSHPYLWTGPRQGLGPQVKFYHGAPVFTFFYKINALEFLTDIKSN